MEFAQPRLIPLTLHSAGLRAFGRRSAAIRSRVVAQHGLWKLTVQLNAQPQKLASFISELRNDARASPSFRLFAFPLNGAGRNSPIESIPTKCIGINRDRSGSTTIRVPQSGTSTSQTTLVFARTACFPRVVMRHWRRTF